MALILRIRKPDIPSFVRCYRSQRRQRTHYEVLNVSPTSSQKEIRHAFIKLSKEMHPDISGKQSHSDFVKINEAYTVLSKDDTRKQYDMNLHYNNYSTPSYHTNAYNYPRPTVVYPNRREWEASMAGGPRPSYDKNYQPSSAGLLIALLILCGGVIMHGIIIQRLLTKRERRLRMSDENERLYREIREKAEAGNMEDQMAEFIRLNELAHQRRH